MMYYRELETDKQAMRDHGGASAIGSFASAADCCGQDQGQEAGQEGGSMSQVRLINEDCIAAMKDLADNSVDSIVTDPPYELGFMGKAWDSTGIANSVEMWKEALRVLKPGGHLLSFGGSRTYHRMVCAVEDAGFEVRDQIMWVYGSGFPKSLDVSKALDAYAKTGRSDSQVTGDGRSRVPGQHFNEFRKGSAPKADFTPTDEAAKQWQGWGTALKPAHEPICVARKPFAKGDTVAKNVLAHSVGALNIDACRVSGEPSPSVERRKHAAPGESVGVTGWITPARPAAYNEQRSGEMLGRWPANFIHDGSDEVVEQFPTTTSGTGAVKKASSKDADGNTGTALGKESRPAGTEMISYGDTGNASRFFYCAKPGKKDKGEGNKHPTVKPTALMAYLCKLVTPPGGVVLDPFAGSGSTGVAAVREGFRFIGVDSDADSVETAAQRILKEGAEVAVINEAGTFTRGIKWDGPLPIHVPGAEAAIQSAKETQ